MGLIPAVGNIVATQSANNTAIKTTAATNKANKELAELQNQWNLEQWHRENEYNHPAEQAKRLKEAGLSDAAAAQAVSGGQSGRLQSANLSNQVAPPAPQVPDLSGLNSMSIIGIARQLEALRKESADADITETNAEWQDEIVFTEVDAKRVAARATADANTRENELHPYRIQQDYYKAQSDKEYIGHLKAQTRLANLNCDKLQQEISVFMKKSQAEIDEIAARIENLGKQGKVLDAQHENIQANTAKTNQETTNLKKEEKLKELEIDAKELQNIMSQTGLPQDFLGVKASQIMTGKITFEDFASDLRTFKRSSYSLYNSLAHSPITRQWARELLKHNADGGSIVTDIVEGAEKLGTSVGSMVVSSDEHGDYGE